MCRTKNQKPNNQDSKKWGFSLIELLVAIGLMAVLSAGVVSLIGTSPQKSSRDSRRKADLELIRSGLELYRNDRGYYPVTAGWETSLGGYVSNIPTDPKTTTTHYKYTGSGSCSSGTCTYSLCTADSIPLEKTGAAYCVTNP